MLFNIPEDTPLIGKLMVNYRCLLRHEDEESAQQDFKGLVRYLYLRDQNAEVQQFCSEYFAEMSEEAKK